MVCLCLRSFSGDSEDHPRRAIFLGPAANNRFKFLFVQLETKATPHNMPFSLDAKGRALVPITAVEGSYYCQL